MPCSRFIATLGSVRGTGRAAAAALVALGLLWPLAGYGADRALNQRLRDLPDDRWVEIHRQRPADAVSFRRQAHGGSAFDSKRGRIVLFGSDSHGDDWTNSPLYFDVASSTWTRAYPNDDPSTYRVTEAGIPVAGGAEPHPWAMHTFAAVTYDALNDRIVVASYPQHLEPGRFTNALAHLWPKISRHPTWLFDLRTERWRALSSPATHFFPYATAFDSHRAVVVGYRADGIYELPLGEKEPRWSYIAPASKRGYHTNAAYDSRRRRVIVAGSHDSSNDVVIYDPSARRDRVMPTPGVRPSQFQHTPMAFHGRKGLTVLVVDRSPQRSERPGAETWVYDADGDRWMRIETATLPFANGMNYNLHYDPLHDALLLVSGGADGVTAVWALKLR